jgi:hypothetical protein
MRPCTDVSDAAALWAISASEIRGPGGECLAVGPAAASVGAHLTTAACNPRDPAQILSFIPATGAIIHVPSGLCIDAKVMAQTDGPVPAVRAVTGAALPAGGLGVGSALRGSGRRMQASDVPYWTVTCHVSGWYMSMYSNSYLEQVVAAAFAFALGLDSSWAEATVLQYGVWETSLEIVVQPPTVDDYYAVNTYIDAHMAEPVSQTQYSFLPTLQNILGDSTIEIAIERGVLTVPAPSTTPTPLPSPRPPFTSPSPSPSTGVPYWRLVFYVSGTYTYTDSFLAGSVAEAFATSLGLSSAWMERAVLGSGVRESTVGIAIVPPTIADYYAIKTDIDALMSAPAARLPTTFVAILQRILSDTAVSVAVSMRGELVVPPEGIITPSSTATPTSSPTPSPARPSLSATPMPPSHALSPRWAMDVAITTVRMWNMRDLTFVQQLLSDVSAAFCSAALLDETAHADRVSAAFMSGGMQGATVRIYYTYPSMYDYYFDDSFIRPIFLEPAGIQPAFLQHLQSRHGVASLIDVSPGRIEREPPATPPVTAIPSILLHVRVVAAYLAPLPRPFLTTAMKNTFSATTGELLERISAVIEEDDGASILFEVTIRTTFMRPSDRYQAVARSADRQGEEVWANASLAFDDETGQRGALVTVFLAAHVVEPIPDVPFWTTTITLRQPYSTYSTTFGHVTTSVVFAVAWAIRAEWSWVLASSVISATADGSEVIFLIEVRPPTVSAFNGLREKMLTLSSRATRTVVDEHFAMLTGQAAVDAISMTPAALYDGPDPTPAPQSSASPTTTAVWQGELYFAGLSSTTTTGQAFRDAVKAAIASSFVVPRAWVTVDSVAQVSGVPGGRRSLAGAASAAANNQLRQLQGLYTRVQYTVKPPTPAEYAAVAVRIDAGIEDVADSPSTLTAYVLSFVAAWIGEPSSSFTASLGPVTKAMQTITPTPEPQASLSVGAIGGIAAGGVVALGLATATAYYVLVHLPASAAAKAGVTAAAASNDPVVTDASGAKAVVPASDTVVFRVPQPAVANPAYGLQTA